MSTRGLHIVEDDDVMHGYVVSTGARTCGKTIYRCVATWGDWTETELGFAAGLDNAKAVVVRGEMVSPPVRRTIISSGASRIFRGLE